MRNPIELNYVKKNGMLYPDLQISNHKDDDKRPIGKYGMMWLRFMKEWHYDRYVELRMDGELLHIANKVNDNTYDIISLQIKNNDFGINRIIIESKVVTEFVLKIR